MVKKALVVLAEGFEEIEAIAPIDILRRSGVRVTVAGLTERCVKSSRSLGVQTDILLKDLAEAMDAVILPGGVPGTANLARSAELGALIKRMNGEGRLVAAICAAPAAVLAPLGILDGKKATCYPGCEGDFSGKTDYSKNRVVVDGNIVTSQGPGTALEFSLEIVRYLVGNEMVETLREKMILEV